MRSPRYEHGLDILGEGADVASFLPWLGVVSSLAGGIAGASDKKKGGDKGLGGLAGGLTGGGAAQPARPSGPTAQQAVATAMRQERARQEAEKLKASAARTKILLYSVLGVLGVGVVGGAVYLVARK